MCGRFVVTDSTSTLLAELVSDFEPPQPDYNVAPTTDVTVVRTRHDERTATHARWGFVPGWAKDFATQRPQPINARIETVATSSMFRKSFATARCIVVAYL